MANVRDVAGGLGRARARFSGKSRNPFRSGAARPAAG